MPDSILFTQCLQNDFVKPIGKYDKLPNLLHIGYEESIRLMGVNPAEGPITNTMKWAYAQSIDDLEIIHIRSWYKENDPAQEKYFEKMGKHCIAGSEGA
ncbi:MAG: isochorismatase, partial [Marinilabiliales bacterium]